MSDLQARIDYYESLLEYLENNVPCLDVLIDLFDEQYVEAYHE